PLFTSRRCCVYAQAFHMSSEPSTNPDEYPNPWRIQVRGHPARVKDIRWREAIREGVKGAYPEAPFPAPDKETEFEVAVTFRMTREDLRRPAFDLDNFVKPVLDTLFTSQNVSPEVTGVLLAVNDTWVFRLVLEKVGVETPQDQGADITVTSHPPGTPALSTAPASPSSSAPCQSHRGSAAGRRSDGVEDPNEMRRRRRAHRGGAASRATTGGGARRPA